MTKVFMGARLRLLREERGLSQTAAARTLGLSASYYNQLENDERPLTSRVLAKMSAAFDIDAQAFSDEAEARLLADMREVVATSLPEEAVAVGELREAANRTPAVGRAVVSLHRKLRLAIAHAEAVSRRHGERTSSPDPVRPMPFEEVRDFFYARRNYVDELDVAAERLFAEAGLRVGDPTAGLAERLRQRHGVTLAITGSDTGLLRKYDPGKKHLSITGHLSPAQRAFQMATQIALLEAGRAIDRIVDGTGFSSDEAGALARIGLADYFAAALLMPYRTFLHAAAELRYDVERLARRFGVGFEGTCHRLSTLQRKGARGVPFFFIRVDRAGNISKRQSATDFHFSRVGGTCPLWNVYEAFVQPGRIVRQLAQMPDGRTYLWVARTVTATGGGYLAPTKTFAIALGCDVRHARRLVYSHGLDLADPTAPTPIGAGCKVCPRSGCPQRAFPPAGERVVVDADERRFEPYSIARRSG